MSKAKRGKDYYRKMRNHGWHRMYHGGKGPIGCLKCRMERIERNREIRELIAKIKGEQKLCTREQK